MSYYKQHARKIVSDIAKGLDISYEELTKDIPQVKTSQPAAQLRLGHTTTCYKIPINNLYPRMTPGETWLCENHFKGSKPPRGKIYRNGIKRFKNRTWTETSPGIMEFLPNDDKENT